MQGWIVLAIRCRVRACVRVRQSDTAWSLLGRKEGFLADSSTLELALLPEGSVCLVVVHVVALVTLLIYGGKREL